jgi:hypothetical protein
MEPDVKLSLILPLLCDYLPPSELLRAVSPLSCLMRASCSLLLKDLQEDFARGKEKLKIPCKGDGSGIPVGFRYVSQPINAHIVGSGCSCSSDACDDGCPCISSAVGDTIQECGPACNCSSACEHRSTQKGLTTVALQLVHLGLKGWGVIASTNIKMGTFLAEYVGERIRNDSADERLRGYDLAGMGHALLIVRQTLPSGLILRSNIDATSEGNIARFINHSCDPNLMLAVVHRSGSLLPSPCLFALRDIATNEELTFSYGDMSASSGGQGVKKCSCGSSKCKGVMPSE